ncbi:tetratricopeptide repeat protein [Uliginosibacterium sp. H1]|uniref:tetratricopeptide repeat protein n=1 Tax=Uliginosibacterium sp. H1 TaxID=3114757 RepID=UPI002E187805|nr:tetratricopeptide repeat protein [Uliginosibacterium sp. H1]
MKQTTPSLLLAAALLLPLPVLGIGSDDPPPNAANAAREDFTRGRAAIDKEDWPGAINAFGRVVRAEPRNADAWNWIGYASRRSGKLDDAFKAYDKALAADPGHRGAHEYVGEAWLMASKPDKAEEHLAALARLCNAQCKEYEALKQALGNYLAGRKPSAMSNW